MSLGAGIRWATVSLLNNTSIRALVSDWLSLPWGRWRSHRTTCMLHSSRTSSTSSTSTPAWSAGEQHKSTHVKCVCVCLCVHALSTQTHTEHWFMWNSMHYKINSLLSICAARLDTKMLNSTECDAWSCTKALILLLGPNTDAARGKIRRANRGYTLKALIKRR